MTKKAWLIFILICAVILGGLIYSSRQDKVNVEDVNALSILPASDKNGNIADHVYGKKDSKVVLYEYGDYQCPGCGQAAPIVKQVAEKYKDKMALVFRNYPLVTAHPNALAAASVAEAAGLQGKYWEMHNKLYETQKSWEKLAAGNERTSYFATLASDLGLDTNKLAEDIDSSAVQKKISYDTALGKKQNITGTPTLYLNNKNVSDIYYKDDAIVSQTTQGAQRVWSDADAFDKLIIQPALKEHGISF